MSQYDAKKIEEYQLILLKNPRSPVFAALSEAYRKMGLLEEALETVQKGLGHNPNFTSGLVAQAKVLFEMKMYQEALPVLSKAQELNPENLLALKLSAYCYVKMKKYLRALRAYKKLLVMNPNDEKALSFIHKWEFLEYTQFEGGDLDIKGVQDWVEKIPHEQQIIHLVDSFFNRGEKKQALEVLDIGRLRWPESEELKNREQLLKPAAKEAFRLPRELQIRKDFYKKLLQRIEEAKIVDPTALP